jgi:tetratricopeptide (TPR) repeat protein
MIVRAKTKRRLMGLLIAAVIFLALVVTLVLVRQRQIRLEFQALRQEGIAACDKEDYSLAIPSLSRYIARYPDDLDAAFKLAQALRKATSSENRQLRGAVQLVRRVLDRQPGRLEAKYLLLELYNELGFNSEAIEAALQLPKDDPAAIRALALARVGMRQYKEALPDARKYTALKPEDLEMQVLTLQLLDQCSLNNEILARAALLLQETPQRWEDGRFELLMGIAFSLTREWTPAEQSRARELVLKKDPQAKLTRWDRADVAKFFIQKAAQRIPPDVYFVQLLVMELDRLGLPSESVALLERASTGRKDPWLRRMLVHRLWENDRFDEIDKALQTLSPELPSADPDLLAFRAMSLARLDRKPEAQIIADALARRQNNALASAWAAVVHELFLAPAPNAKRCTEVLQEFLAGRRDNPYLLYFLAESYLVLGEYDLAAELFSRVQATNPFWAMPLVRLSRLLMESGERDRARFAAELAFRRSPTSLLSAVNLASVSFAQLDLNQTEKTARLLDVVASVQTAAPGEPETLPIYVLLLGKSGKTDEARKALRAALDAKSPPAQTLLFRLAAASREANLGLENACFDLSAAAHGQTPDLLFARAIDLLLKGKGADGLRLIEDASRNQPPEQALTWRILNARYLEEMKDARAAATWIALADDPAYAGQLQLQRAALLSPSVQSDRQFISRTIDRIRNLTGEHSAGWRMARARWLLTSPDKIAESAQQAGGLLNEVVRLLPSYPDARILLSSAFERSGNMRAAIEQLAIAAKLRPASNPIALELARLYQAQADYQRAREQIDRLNIETLDPAQRRQVVALLAQQGDSSRAMDIMRKAAPTTNAVDAADNLYLVELHRRRNQIPEAEKLLEQLLQAPTLPVIVTAADFYASRGRKDEAERQLARLKDLQLPPGARPFALGQYYSLYGSPEQALANLEAAVKDAPNAPTFAYALLRQHLQMGRVNDALAAAQKARPNLPDDPVLAALAKHADLLAQVAADRSFTPLITGIVDMPDDAPIIADAIRLIWETQRDHQPVSILITKLRPLADRAPRLIALQRTLIDKYASLGRMDDAVVLATRCIQNAPTSPELAQLAAEVVATAGNFDQALSFARQWRDLTLADPLPADLFIAKVRLFMNQPDDALTQLKDYLPVASQQPETYRPVLALQARALIAKNQAPAAAELLWPLVSRAAPWRALWIDLAIAVKDVPALEAWINRITPVMPPNALNEQISLANAWFQAGKRFKEPRYIAKARALLDTLVARPDASGECHLARAVMYDDEGNTAAAEAGYRRALQMRADLLLAQNNLAMILAPRGQNAEALALASAAVQAQPRIPDFLDTLAFVQIKAKDYKSATTNLKNAISLDPDNLKWRLNLAEALLESGDRPEALRTLQEIDRLVPLLKELPPNSSQRLDALRASLRAKPPTTVPVPVP